MKKALLLFALLCFVACVPIPATESHREALPDTMEPQREEAPTERAGEPFTDGGGGCGLPPAKCTRSVECCVEHFCNDRGRCEKIVIP